MFWRKMREVKEKAALLGIPMVAGGDWNAVTDVMREQNPRPGGEERKLRGGDRMIGPAMRGLVEVTKESGATYRDTGTVWGRIDSWWAAEGLECRANNGATREELDFMRHRGVGMRVRVEEPVVEEWRERTLARLPEGWRLQGSWSPPPFNASPPMQTHRRIHRRAGARQGETQKPPQR